MSISLAIVGATGAVGEKMRQVLIEKKFPFTDLRLFASKKSVGKKFKIAGVWHTVEAMRAAGREGGLAINPDTPVAKIADLLPELDAVLVMGVMPGWSGQQFQSTVLGKVSELKRLRPGLRVEVDGGVTPAVAADLTALGCDGVIAASALFEAPDLKKAVADFEQALTV